MNHSMATQTAGREAAPLEGDHRTEYQLPAPAKVLAQQPMTPGLAAQISQQRHVVRGILHGEDDRMLVVVGPCSLHDEKAALDYGRRLAQLAEEVSDRLFLVMRAYVEKPRTTVGWKGLLYDPDRNGLGDMAKGIAASRRLMMSLAEMGLPLATEALSPLSMDYLGDLISWTAIGARTTESQVHRELASGLPMPVGFKNGTDGSVDIAAHAMKSASHPHQYIGLSGAGFPAMIHTRGNVDTHLVLRGGRGLTNFDETSIHRAMATMEQHGVNPAVMVDCSHDNACKQPERQPDIARDVMAQKRNGNRAIVGLMLESFIEQGRQDDGADLKYGCSITDPCLGWDQTEALLRSL